MNLTSGRIAQNRIHVTRLIDSFGEECEWANSSEAHRMESVTRMLADEWPLQAHLPRYFAHYTHVNQDLTFVAIQDCKLIVEALTYRIIRVIVLHFAVQVCTYIQYVLLFQDW